MRLHLATILLAAGTLAACASNPPPPPPMAPMADATPMTPAPAPMMSGPAAGVYRGTSEATGTLGRRCTRPGPVTVRVARNNTFSVLGMRGRVGPDGTVSSGRRGGLSGTVANGSMDVNVSGRCGYHVTATKA